ncbi:unnamed protein product [Leptidea sinapis]|uniref:Lipase n=1 Tax=Leptidea sinapis TaxID=189913 RepID=A0A5E4R4C0_9NEOP|nr:unnamed protein product [Leptidea sinapis]
MKKTRNYDLSWMEIRVTAKHQRILSDGYPAESYDVTTEDGYILEVNRIPRGRKDLNNGRPRPVVFMMHGLQGSANAYIELGPENSMAYILANYGFDVWLGNARGVERSRRHVSLDPDSILQKRKFWDFTWEEIALNDLPAMIDFILSKTGQEKLHYVGHSQGGTVFLVLNSMKPEYNEKFKSAHLLAGVGYKRFFPNRILTKAAQKVDEILFVTRALGFVELLGPGLFSDGVAPDTIDALTNEQEIQSYGLVDAILNLFKEALEELSRSKAMVGGAAVKQYAHYGQNIRDKKFRRWDYGKWGNLLKYGWVDPPQYNLRRITVDITMHYTLGDNLLHELDVIGMSLSIPNCKIRRVARRNFSHTDFVVANDSRELVTEYILNDLARRNQ